MLALFKYHITLDFLVWPPDGLAYVNASSFFKGGLFGPGAFPFLRAALLLLFGTDTSAGPPKKNEQEQE